MNFNRGQILLTLYFIAIILTLGLSHMILSSLKEVGENTVPYENEQSLENGSESIIFTVRVEKGFLNSVFGETRHNDAYVTLKNGKTLKIPVHNMYFEISMSNEWHLKEIGTKYEQDPLNDSINISKYVLKGPNEELAGVVADYVKTFNMNAVFIDD